MTLRDLFEMDGRVAVVTGSGQGIGRAIALGLADFGCDVVLNSRRVRDLEVTATEIEKRGRSVLIVQGDIRDFSETLAWRTMERFGRLDIWVNNVGGSDEKTTRPLVETSDEVFRSQIDLNLTSAFQGCKAAASRMGDAGSIINISSGAGTRGSPFTGPYAAAKAGMNNLTQTLALELAPAIRVNAVAPGPVYTRLNVGYEFELESYPLPRVGTVEDMAQAVGFLASPASAYITGEVLKVAGGVGM